MSDTRFDTTLSERGAARRDEMLAPLKREVAIRGARRRAARAAAAASPLLILSLVLVWPALRSPTSVAPPALTGPESRHPATATDPRPAPAFAHVSYAEIRTRTDLASHTITDAELLDLLREAGHPDAGIARRGSECIIVGLPTADLPGPGSDAAPSPRGRVRPAAPAPTHSLGR